MQYNEYLKSLYWGNFREQAIIHFKNKCCSCKNTTDLEVHHIHYESIGRETLDDVKVMYKKCHKEAHFNAK